MIFKIETGPQGCYEPWEGDSSLMVVQFVEKSKNFYCSLCKIGAEGQIVRIGTPSHPFPDCYQRCTNCLGPQLVEAGFIW